MHTWILLPVVICLLACASGCPEVVTDCENKDGDDFATGICFPMDCDDDDPAVYPFAPEICGDGIDQNCDQRDMACDCPDYDGDGFSDRACGGSDCDDGDSTRTEIRLYQGEESECDDGLDNDCDSYTDADDYDCNPCSTNEDCDDGNAETLDACDWDAGCSHLFW